ncbi:hypothetical protein P3T43_004591 [Paraburkholderia sp. GAS41]
MAPASFPAGRAVNISAPVRTHLTMAKKASNVINIKSDKFWKQFTNRLKRDRGVIDVLPDLWDSAVTRHISDDEQPRKSDPITIDGDGALELGQWFSRVGFPMPQTWAEFRAGQWYIGNLLYSLNTLRIGFPHIPKLGVEFIEKQYP